LFLSFFLLEKGRDEIRIIFRRKYKPFDNDVLNYYSSSFIKRFGNSIEQEESLRAEFTNLGNRVGINKNEKVGF
jgi:hypothetical protein